MTEYGESGVADRRHRCRTLDKASTGRRANYAREFVVSTFNVRTLRNTETKTGTIISHKLQQLVAGCEKYHIDIVSLQEHRLHTTNGENFNILNKDLNGWTLAHSNSCNTSHGVAILYSNNISQVVDHIECKSDRIIVAHLRGNPRVCVLSVYAPTETGDKAAKDAFYQDLESVITSLPPHTVVIVAGDLNARLGQDSHLTNPLVVGPNCFHEETNSNGQRMIALCEFAKLRPAFSHFEDRRSRMATFTPPGKETAKNQLGHILINTKWWKSIKSCRAFTSLDIGSDHKIVSANFRLSLRATKRPPNDRCNFNTEKFADPDICKRFDIELRNRFSALFTETTTAENEFDEVKLRADALDTALIETSKSVLGKRTRRKQPHWVSTATLGLMDEQEEAKRRHKLRPTTASRAVWLALQKSVSAAFEKDQAANLNAQINDLVLAAKKREYGTVWKIVGYISEPPKSSIKVLKLDGSIPSSKEEILDEWRKYFEALLNNKSATANAATRPSPAPDLRSIPTAAITRLEVVSAISSLKNGKAPGPDYAMTAEALKHGGDFIVDQLHYICRLVYNNNRAPSQWTSSLIIPLPKKGNLQLMSNYRGISLMSIAAKVYNRILLNRIREPIDQLRKNQAGFRTGRSCIQQIHILRRLIDGADIRSLPLFLTFIDFKKAFDSVDRDMMFAILRHYGIPLKIVDAIRVLYDNSTSRVYVEGQTSELFNITTGVLQGDVLAPFLFIIVIDYISKRSAGDSGIQTHKGNPTNTSGRSMRSSTRNVDRTINDLSFADDIVLLESETARAQVQVDNLRRESSEVGLEFNNFKIDCMILNRTTNSQPLSPPLLDGKPIEVVEDFKYLGSYIGSTDKDVSNRIGLAWAAFAKLKPILLSRTGKPSIKLKITLFDAACISILLYGCESWVLTKKQLARLDIFARTCYRSILGIRQSEAHMTNDELYKLAGAQPISSTIRQRQLKFTGHCLRMNIDEPANIYVLYPNSSSALHKREGKFVGQIADYLCHHLPKSQRFTAAEISKCALDKKTWNQFVVAPYQPD